MKLFTFLSISILQLQIAAFPSFPCFSGFFPVKFCPAPAPAPAPPPPIKGPSSSPKHPTIDPNTNLIPVIADTQGVGIKQSVSTQPANKVKYGGVNIAGFDFGCSNTAGCNIAQIGTSLVTSSIGQKQIAHFVSKGLNTFRLPVSWEYLSKGNPGSLDQNNWSVYNQLVQACISSAELCIIDIHNYARYYNMGIIGAPGGPTIAQFANFWAALASKYANNNKVAFELMNEPHDLDPFVTLQGWANTVQTAVTEIRQVGATSNMILITGLDWSSAGAFESAFNVFVGPVNNVKNPDGSNGNLIYSVHQYLDGAGGVNPWCTDTTGPNIFKALANVLNQNGGRKAMLTEFGGGNNQQCVQLICAALDTVNSLPAFLGVTMWSAGLFDVNYVLSETPFANGTDQLLAQDCTIPKLGR